MKKLSRKTVNMHVLLAVASFVIPILLMLIVGIICKLFPLGNRVLLINDIDAQYAAFFSYFKDIIYSNNDFTYTFTKCLGGDMVGFSAYYLHNPFLWITIFLLDNEIVSAIYLILAIQIGFMGLTFYLLLSDNYGDKLIHLIFTTAYALMGYNIAYIVIPQYYCSLILLPIVIMGINRLVADAQKFILYSVSLGLAVYCNYYTGYMICIFCGLYFLTLMGCGRVNNVKTFIRFVGASSLGVLLSSFSLVPTVLSIAGTKSLPAVNDMNLIGPEYSIKMLIRNMLPMSFYGDTSNACAPYVYCGMITLFAVLVFLATKRIAARVKISYTCLVCVLLVSTYISLIDVIWHGFNSPVGFSHRYAFVISFMLIYMGAMGFAAIGDEIELNDISVFKLLKNKYVIIGLMLVQSVELVANATHTLNTYFNITSSYTEYEDYEEYLSNVGELINGIKSADKSFYRIEKDFERNHNDSMQFSYAGLTHNSSCEKDYVKQFIGRMGFRNQGIWAFYNEGSTAFSDCLLGVKYYISRFDTVDKPFIPIYSEQDRYYTYRNDYALPLCFMTSDNIKDVDMRQEDLFSIQNDIASAFNYDGTIYNKNDNVEVLLDNVACSYVDVEATNESGTNSDISKSTVRYSLIEESQPGLVKYKIVVNDTSNVYCYFSAPYQQHCELYVNGVDRGDYFSDYRWSIVNLGRYNPGDEVIVTFELGNNTLDISNAFFYEENLFELVEWATKVKSYETNLEMITSSHLTGRVNANEDGLLAFSIAYEPDWLVYIDGTKVKQQKILDALLAVPVNAGQHTIEMIYVPRGIYIGRILSIVAIIILVGCGMYMHRTTNSSAEKRNKMKL